MSNLMSYGDEARDKMLTGVNKLADAVKVTLGPGGRNVMIRRQGRLPVVTKDGVTVAKSITLKDPLEDLGAQMTKEVSAQTADSCGDGTTTSSVLAQAIAREGMKVVTAGANPMSVKRGIESACEVIVDALSEMAKPVNTMDEIVQVATISGNNDPSIGALIGTAIEKVGNDGVITIEDSRDVETTLDVVEGLQINRGWQSPMFINEPERGTCMLFDPLIFVIEQNMQNPHDFRKIMNEVKDTRSMLFICSDISDDVLGMIAMNVHGQRIKACVVKNPEMGESLKSSMTDIAKATGAVLFSKELGYEIKNLEAKHAGSANYVKITRDNTTIVNGAGTEISEHVELLRSQMNSTDSGYEREKLRNRIAKISGGVAVIRVGGENEVAMGEKRDRIDDALHATRSAIAEGIVAGGGTALIRATSALRDVLEQVSKTGTEIDQDEITGVKIVMRACEEPLRQIVANVGLEGSVYVNKVREMDGNFGFNAKTHQFEDLVLSGVIDPVKVTKSAIMNAGSIAGLLLSTECVIVQE